MFDLYFTLGLQHIADFKGYDHIIFLITLCAAYRVSNWKKILILVTAFTIGHTTTLALATLRFVQVNTYLIELLIPVTIFMMGIINLIKPDTYSFMKAKYATALLFGLIHGLGFSNYLRMLLNEEANITVPLVGFNVGVEVGQIFIVAIILAISTLIMKFTQFKRHDWIILLSGIGLGTSFIMFIDRV
jgi:hypothetical protein